MTGVARYRAGLTWGIAIFCLAFAVRLAFVLWIDADPQRGTMDDSWFYHHAARAMADGRGYIFPGQGGAPTAYWPPGYIALLSGVYALPGADLLAGKLLNVILGATGAALLYATGNVLAGRATGIVAGLLLALFPSNVFYAGLTLTEVTFATLVTGIALLFVWILATARLDDVPPALMLGLAVGAATLVRGEALLLPVLLAGVAWLATGRARTGLRFGALALLALAVVLAGWTVRNAIQMDAFVPLNTGSSVVLAISHWDHADGGGDRVRAREVLSYYSELSYPEREVKGARKRTADALTYMLTHPEHELSLILRRLAELYRHDHAAVDWLAHHDLAAGEGTLDLLRWASDVYYFAVLALAGPGMAIWWRKNRAAASCSISPPLSASSSSATSAITPRSSRRSACWPLRPCWPPRTLCGYPLFPSTQPHERYGPTRQL